MFPTLLYSNDREATEEFINTLIQEKKIKTSYIYRIEPKEKTIIIDQIRELNSLLQIKSPQIRLIRIDLFETATHESQNAMLKILEEKTADNQFVLVINNLQKILPTILSRCNLVDLFKEDNTVEEDLLLHINGALENPESSLLATEVFQPATRDEAIGLFKKIIIVLEQKIKAGNMQAVQLAKKAFDLLGKLESNNLNHQLTVDAFLLSLLKTK